MRKLFNFYRICFCYFVLILFFHLGIILHYLFSCLFVFINSDAFHEVSNKFVKDLCKIVEDKIKDIKQDEYDILNEDINERCLNGEYGLIPRRLSWKREILISILILAFVIFLLFMKNC